MWMLHIKGDNKGSLGKETAFHRCSINQSTFSFRFSSKVLFKKSKHENKRNTLKYHIRRLTLSLKKDN
jgi:hypothetical protein